MRGVGPGREGPDPAPRPVPAVAAGGGPELVLAVGRVDPVLEAQPGHRRRGADGHAAVGGAVGEGHLLAELGLAGVPDGHVGEAQEVVVVQVDGQAGLLVVADVVGAEVDGQLGLDGVGAGRGVAQQQRGVVAGPDQVGGLGRPAQHPAGLGGRRVGPADPGPGGVERPVAELVGVDHPADPRRRDLMADRVVEAGRAHVGGLDRAAAGGRADGPGPAGAGGQGPALDGHRVVEPGVGDLHGQHPAAQLGGDVVPDVVAEPFRQRAGLPAEGPPAPDHVGDQGPGLAVEPAHQVVAPVPPAGDQAGGGRALAKAQVGLGPVVGRRAAGRHLDLRLAGPGGAQLDRAAADGPVGDRGPLRPFGGPAAGPDRRPAVDPVQPVEQHRPLVDAERLVQVGVAAVDGVVDEPVLAGQVGYDGVVAGADPVVAVGGDHDGAADPRGGQRDAVAVGERPPRAPGAAGEHRVAGGGAGAAVGLGGEQVVPAAVADDVGALVAVVDGHHGRRAHRPGGVLVQLGDEDPTVVGAVVQVAGAVQVGELRRVEGPEEVVRVAAGARAGADHRSARVAPGAGRAVRGGHPDGVVVGPGGHGRLGDHVVQVVGAVQVADVGRPQGGVGGGPAWQGGLGEGVAHVGPVDQVGRAGGGDDAPGALALVERVGGAVGVPPAVLGLDHGRVGEGVGEVAGDRVGVGAGCGLGGGRHEGGPGQAEGEQQHGGGTTANRWTVRGRRGHGTDHGTNSFSGRP